MGVPVVRQCTANFSDCRGERGLPDVSPGLDRFEKLFFWNRALAMLDQVQEQSRGLEVKTGRTPRAEQFAGLGVKLEVLEDVNVPVRAADVSILAARTRSSPDFRHVRSLWRENPQTLCPISGSEVDLRFI